MPLAAGLINLEITYRNPDFDQNDPYDSPVLAQSPESLTFSDVACAINIGIELLETPMVRAKLERLGIDMVTTWTQEGSHAFGGDIRNMRWYVKHFLDRLRNEFPSVKMSEENKPGTTASFNRYIPSTWSGDLHDFRPSNLGWVTFYRPLVSSMVAASSGARDRRLPRAERARLLKRHKTFLFRHAMATFHEMIHCFGGYLAQGSASQGSYTPEEISIPEYLQQPNPWRGESGRWMEDRVLGGCLEYLMDLADDNGQAGVPYLFRNGLARRIRWDSINDLVRSTPVFSVPFELAGPSISLHDPNLAARTGHSWPAVTRGPVFPLGPLYMTTMMQFQQQQQPPMARYCVPVEELHEIVEFPDRLRNFWRATQVQ